MNHPPPRIFGRTEKFVPFIWRPLDAGAAGDESWCALEIGPEALDRKADPLVVAQLASLGRKRCDLLIVRDIFSSDLKIGWPTHRLMQLRDRGLCDYFAIETHSPLEAEWIATHASVHAIVAPYHSQDMSLRYRVFDIARTVGMAIVSRATTIDALRLQLGTPDICATIVEASLVRLLESENLTPLPEPEIENLWTTWRRHHPAPPKLPSGHPPE